MSYPLTTRPFTGPDESGRYQCCTCKEWKSSEGFHSDRSSKRGLSSRCRDCHVVYVRSPEAREKNRKVAKRRTSEARDLLERLRSVPCSDCGGVFPVCCMEFDHLDGTDKSFSIANLVGGGITQRFLDEIAKCQVVCANCHRIRGFARGQFQRAPGRRRKADGE